MWVKWVEMSVTRLRGEARVIRFIDSWNLFKQTLTILTNDIAFYR